jgi:hypothetical protein
MREGTIASNNWAGYVVYGSSGSVSEVYGTWNVPIVSVQWFQNTYSSCWVGIDGGTPGARTIEQIGTEQDVNWYGATNYYAWYEMGSDFEPIKSMTIHPGDQMSAMVLYEGSGYFFLDIYDQTTGASFGTIYQIANAQLSTAEWVVEWPNFPGALANFGTVLFTNCYATVNNVYSSISAFQYNAVVMINQFILQPYVNAYPSGLVYGGTTFGVDYVTSLGT